MRARIEQVFARQKDPMGLFTRSIGIARAGIRITLTNLVYNIDRYRSYSLARVPLACQQVNNDLVRKRRFRVVTPVTSRSLEEVDLTEAGLEGPPMPEPAERLPVAGALTAVGGFLDAFTFVGHGHVFANSMTGHVVLMGLAVAVGDLAQIIRHVIPIVAFLAGVFAAHLIRLRMANKQRGKLEQLSLLLEIGFLVTVAFLPYLPGELIILGIAFVAAVQSTTFTRVNGGGYNSTMTTGNLRRFAEMLYKGTIPRHDATALRQARTFAIVCCCFLVGATIGGFTTLRFGSVALLAPVAALIVVLLMIFDGSGRQ